MSVDRHSIRAKRRALFQRQGGRCGACDEYMTLCDMTMHHVHARRHGGSNGIANLVGLHLSCHIALEHQIRKVEQERAAAYRLGARPELRAALMRLAVQTVEAAQIETPIASHPQRRFEMPVELL